ncbi:MAG: hypothetical protein IID46_12435, partial [Planctomycetes bacterium]|nr:hypothetical protein [Planctomycetota bacterium]
MSAYDETELQSNQRMSRRMWVADSDDGVVLCHGPNRSPARVIDVSTGGYGVEAGSDVVFLLDQIIQLETNNWTHNVRVAYFKKCDGVNRIGLQLVSDRPVSSEWRFMEKVRSSANLGDKLQNAVRRMGRVINPEKWQLSAGFI